MVPSPLIFISAQPDELYFHWQVELYLNNFLKKGINKDQLFTLFGFSDKPSQFIINLKKDFPGIHWYKDTRENKIYQPGIRPHILKKFFKEFPNLGKKVFYHDSDILFYKLPDFKTLVKNDIIYVSDTVSYVGYNYIKECCDRYTNKHSDIPKLDLLNKMADITKINIEVIKTNQKNSGGAQYLLKNIDTEFWEQVETDSNNLYKLMKDYEIKYPICNHIQKWTADMWAVLWNCWKSGSKTLIHSELSFSWAPNKVNNKVTGYKNHNIFHLAGVSGKFYESNKDYFFKGNYQNKNILEILKKDIHFFDYVNTDNNTWMYIHHAIEYISDKYKISYGVKKKVNNKLLVNTYTIKHVPTGEGFIFNFGGIHSYLSGTYIQTNKKYFKKYLWICKENQRIIFYNKKRWVITATKYESEISETCGGFLSSTHTNRHPHQCKWNV